jgi:hypothetical protein
VKIFDRVAHHGDCVGADHTFHLYAATLGFYTVIHPPIHTRWRAYCQGDEHLEAKEYLLRNKDIVRAVDILIACPSGEEKLRSGTWSTVRYARGLGKPIHIVRPDGYVKEER